MYLKNGIWVHGIPSKNVHKPKVSSHPPKRTAFTTSSKRLDSLLKGEARIVIQRTLGGIGDILMATPIARAIKRRHPKSQVTFSVNTEYANGGLVSVLLNNPYIDEIADYTYLVRDEYDSFSDITRAGLGEELRAQNSHTVPRNRIDLFAEAAGFPLLGQTQPIYVVTEEEKSWAKDFVDKSLGSLKPRALIAVHLRSNDPKRTWPSHNLREFLVLCEKRGYHCFLFDWDGEVEQWRIKGTTPVFNFNIRQATSILNACDVLVCPDSAMLHLGGALNMKVVSLFGSMPPMCRINYYPNAVAVVNQKLACLGCIYDPCKNNFFCMHSLKAEAVMAAVEMKLGSQLISSEIELEPLPTSEEDLSLSEIKTFEI